MQFISFASCLLSLSMTHELVSSTCLLLNPITLTLPALLVLLGLFQGPCVKGSQKPRVWPMSEVAGSSRKLHYPLRWCVWRAWAEVGPATWGSGSLPARGRPQGEATRSGSRVHAFSPNPWSGFHCFLNPILLGPQLRQPRAVCHRCGLLILDPFCFHSFKNCIQKSWPKIGPAMRSVDWFDRTSFLFFRRHFDVLESQRWGSPESFRPVPLLVSEHFCSLAQSAGMLLCLSPSPGLRGDFLKL